MLVSPRGAALARPAAAWRIEGAQSEGVSRTHTHPPQLILDSRQASLDGP